MSPRAQTYSADGISRWFAYDAVGNVIRDQVSNVTRCYGHDGLNRVASFKRFESPVDCNNPATAPSVQASYRYDHDNLRTEKTANGQTWRYIYAPNGQLLAETQSDGQSIARQYIWLGGELVAIAQQGQIFYVHNDHLARPEAVTDANRSIVWQTNNTAYGRGSVTTNQIGGLNIGLPGQYHDWESGLWYNWNRYYDASIGRYTQSDPIGLAGGVNTYAYVGGNPVMGVDPTGLEVDLSYARKGSAESGLDETYFCLNCYSVSAHGVFANGRPYVADDRFGTRVLLNVNQVAADMKNHGFNPNEHKNVNLVICDSAKGGQKSLAAQLSNLFPGVSFTGSTGNISQSTFGASPVRGHSFVTYLNGRVDD